MFRIFVTFNSADIHLLNISIALACILEMHSEESSQPYLLEIRSSKFFVYTVINLAVFTDAYLYGLIIPILPFALVERVHLHKEEVQRWIGFLLAAYGAGLIIGARES